MGSLTLVKSVVGSVEDAMRSTAANPAQPRTWTKPSLEFKGTIGETLKGGGGKLSVTGSDAGEHRCEKPHASECS